MGESQGYVQLDSRRRVSLAKFGNPEHTRYIATVDEDGSITLVPAVIVPYRTTSKSGQTD